MAQDSHGPIGPYPPASDRGGRWHDGGVEESRAAAVVAALRDRGVMAHVERAGVYQFGVRVVLGDGRVAVWDTDGTAGLEAQVMRDGVLVGFVPQIPGSAEFDEPATVEAIARARYDA